jgi:hypothetical protein
MVMVREGGWPVKYLLLICGDESAAEHAEEGRDLDEAVQAAAGHPAASYGTIEVRPLLP